MNTNCLEGIKCPKCGNEDSFAVDVKGWATITDDGLGSVMDADWEEDADTVCSICSHQGPWSEFIIPTPKSRAIALLAQYDEAMTLLTQLVQDGGRDKRIMEARATVEEMVYDLADLLREFTTEGDSDD
jgi:predicted nucleic-acid-binding Zn-ribbon protein